MSSDLRPTESVSKRKAVAQIRRSQASRVALDNIQRPTFRTPSNGDNVKYPSRLMAFTKGLLHDKNGFVDDADYQRFAEALTQVDSSVKPDADFDVPTAHSKGYKRNCSNKSGCTVFRRWESPLAGHYFALEGPDPDNVAMAPAPRLGESELMAEMAEVYAMSLVRDMTFAELENPKAKIYYVEPGTRNQVCYQINGVDARVQDLVDELNKFEWFGGGAVTSSLLKGVPHKTLSKLEERRRKARYAGRKKALTAKTLFRGSLSGAEKGDYISQFMTLGAGSDGARANNLIAFGAQRIDQKIQPAAEGIDYMTSWMEWLDIQNGVALTDAPPTEPKKIGAADNPHHLAPTLITKPRHLAEYVHIDQLYQAYFNACLILLANNANKKVNLLEPGFPNNNIENSKGQVTRVGFATFGGPHILSLLTEVATRALRAVRRQKFQIHRRARPERLAAMLTLAANGVNGKMDSDEQLVMKTMAEKMGMAIDGQTPSPLMQWVAHYNKVQNSEAVVQHRSHTCGAGAGKSPKLDPHKNYLLAMAFPEGSPMHAAYGAGHATVAGACVTVLKAFFSMTDELGNPRKMDVVEGGDETLTLEDELNKLASNISIGRDFAGVHYYTDYYDSLRMGERIAVGILQEQMLNYSEPVSMSLNSFDDEALVISTDGEAYGPSAQLSVDGDSSDQTVSDWWTKNTREFPLDSWTPPPS